MKPLLIAHRGDTTNYPENTFDAFQSAFDLGADGVEFDVQCHENGNVIVVHNYTHNPNLEYPSLESVLRDFSQKGRLEIEIKAFAEKCVQKVARIVHQIQPTDIEITSSEIPLIPFIRRHFPKSLVGLIFKPCLIEKWMPEYHIQRLLIGYLDLSGASVLHLDLEYYSEELVDFLHNKGYRAHTHLGLEKTQHLPRVKSLGIDQCSFDDITLLNKAG